MHNQGNQFAQQAVPDCQTATRFANRCCGRYMIHQTLEVNSWKQI